MSLSRRDLLALLIVMGAAIASVTAWALGDVDLGLSLHEQDGAVYVADVTPDGNAARDYFSPGWPILDIVTVDGADVRRGEPVGTPLDGTDFGYAMPWDLGSVGGELHVIDANYRPPAEAVDSSRIAAVVGGFIDPESGTIALGTLVRANAEYELHDSIWALVLGLALGVAVWRILAHGVARQAGRELALLLGATAASPLLMLPIVKVGHPVGIFAGYLVPIGLALLVGLALARRHADRSWVQTATAAAIVATGLAVGQVVRYITSSTLVSDDRSLILLLVAAIAVGPALIAAPGGAVRLRERAATVSFGLVPAAALTLFLPVRPEPLVPLVLVVGLVAWQVIPVERGWVAVQSAMLGARPSRLDAGGTWSPPTSEWRDRLTLGLIAIVAAFGIGQANSWAAVIGLGVATAVGIAVRRGFLGTTWADAAIPLAAAVGIPPMLHAYAAWQFGDAMGWASAAVALPALSVSHLLAARHSDPEWRMRLFLGSAAFVAFSIAIGGGDLRLALVAAGIAPLIPGIPAALAEDRGEARAVAGRLETLAVALTPGVAATVLTGAGVLLIGAWLVAIVVWRRFTLAPLLGLAQRTQLQRDLAVAAAETERARLAADLHDDALQQLTMLVRTLDEGGHGREADEAREIATKLRSVVGDLRLPILDDLGAGAALEWLVERVEPLAGGPVKLERSDAARPPANVELAVFRVAQEALTNAIKHGRPPIAVHYDVRADGRVTLAVDDAGPGIGAGAVEEAPGQGHFGLANMQQRAEQIGALLDVRRWPAGGTRVALEWRPG